jgi:putative DNA primase/helicase
MNFDRIPSELKKRRQWVAYRPDKTPVNPTTGGNAQADNPETWGNYEEAVQHWENHKGNGISGIGYEFSFYDPYCGIDLDKCRDPDSGEIKPWAQEIIKKLDSYTEISPSGTGVHILVKGKLPKGADHQKSLPENGKIEVYDVGRYFTVTGNHLDGTPASIQDRDKELKAFHAEVTAKPKTPPQAPGLPPTLDLADSEVIAKARAAQNGDKFERLMKGEWAGYPTQSEADLALCCVLAFWTRDPGQIDRIVRQSGLMRDKWDRRQSGSTYGAKTIEKALSSTNETYQGIRPQLSQSRAARSGTTKPEPQESRSIGVPDYGLTDQGNAYRFKDQWGRDVRWCDLWGKFLCWDRQKWAPDQVRKVDHLAIKTVRQMYVEASQIRGKDTRKAMANHAKRSEADAKRKAMLSSVKCLLPILPEELDQDQLLLNVLNGTVDLRTGELRPHTRGDYITKLAPVHFDRKAKCPLWWEFLSRILPLEIIEFVQKAVGYSATGLTIEQVFFLLHGGGDNGKSTFLEIIGGILGDYAKETDPETFMVKKHSGIPNDLAALRGARLVKSVETSGGRRISEARIKQMTGGDTLTARFLHAEWFEFKPNFKLWLATNHKPIVKDSTHSMWRRVRFIPYEVQIPKPEQDKRLTEKLKAEYSGILNWIIEGALLWQHEGLEPPEIIQVATQNYREEMDDLGDFLSECCILAPGATETAAELYKAYTNWAERAGEKKPLSKRAFGLTLGERGLRSDRSSGGTRVWAGIGLKAE